jgi:hypothetical protein
VGTTVREAAGEVIVNRASGVAGLLALNSVLTNNLMHCI